MKNSAACGIAHHISRHSLLLCNESFAATNEREAAEIATAEVIRAMTHVGITVVFVTHLYELAHRFQKQHADTTVFLRADRSENGQRTYRLIQGPPLPTSYAEDLYQGTFTPEPTGAG